MEPTSINTTKVALNHRSLPPFTAVKLPLCNKHLPLKHLILKELWCTAAQLISPL